MPVRWRHRTRAPMTTSRRGPRSLPSWLTRTMSPSGSAGCSMPSSGGGAAVDVLCLTHGEASTLHGVDGNLLAVRESELTAAADLLGVSHAWLRNHRDGALGEVDPEILTGAVLDVARGAVPQGLLVFDTTGITGHPDHVAASAAAVRPPRHWTFRCWAGWCPHPSQRSSTASSAPALSDVPRRRSTCRSRWDRSRQLSASRAHASRALPESVLWRRLELLGDTESLRWLRGGGGPPAR